MSLAPEARETRTTCPYCGVGCGLIAETRGSRLEAVRGDPIHPVNRGRVCPKPLELPRAARSPDRATNPLARDSREHPWRAAGWDEAIGEVARRLWRIRDEHGPEAIAFYISGQLLTEDYYAVNKLAKGFLGTNNVDSNSRLCMSSAVSGYVGAYGVDGPPPAYSDLAHANCFLLLGTNTAACHPIVWTRIRDRAREGAEVIVVDPRRTETAAQADLYLPLRPGTDIAFLNAMIHVVERAGMLDDRFIRLHTEGWVELSAAVADWTPERAAEVCGIPASDIERAAEMFGGAKAAMALWSMGANQSSVGTLKNRALNNLCLVSGQIGRQGAGPLSLTGQPNAMGGREVGGLAHLLPGYRSIANAADRAEIEALWGTEPGSIAPEPGLVATDLFDALEDGEVKAVWICATNPAVSMPDSGRARAALERAELVVVQDAYHPTETGALADFVLPAAQWPEKEGTMTNSERRVSLLRRAIDPPGEAMADWEIFARAGRALGFEKSFAWTSAEQVHSEYKEATAGRPCDQTGITYERLCRSGGIQWPCPRSPIASDEHPGTERLYEDARFPTPSGRARLAPTPHLEPAETAGGDFPLTLTTGRVAGQWHTMTRTGKSPKLLAADPEPFVEIHPLDAVRAGVGDARHARLVSLRGSAVTRVRVTTSVREGTVFAPFHWGALHAPAGAGTVNAMTTRATDPVSRQPELKACAVRVESLGREREGPSGAGRQARPGRGAPTRRRLVVVGTGMAGLATVEGAFAHRSPEEWCVTMVGREPQRPYNRIALSQALSGHAVEGSRLSIRPPEWYVDRNVALRTGTAATAIDTEGQAVVTDTGERIEYDALVLATGSTPAMPPIAGLHRRGVHSFRTLADARAIVADASPGSRAVVIGGGLLGLEAARGLVARGAEVTVVHLVDRLMETQLDDPAARMLERELRRLGVTVMLERSTTEILGDARVGGVRFAGGEEVSADLVVVAVGIRPDVELARSSGIEVVRGIVVDDALSTSAPAVRAVGECAEHRGQVYGVWAPLIEQARVAGATIAGAPAAFHGMLPATTLKVAGVDLFTAGTHSATRDDESEVVVMDGRRGLYRKLVLRGDHLAGAVLLGDVGASLELSHLLRSGDAVPEELFGLGAGKAVSSPPEGPSLVCSCNVVTAEAIRAAALDHDLTSVDQVTDATGAGGGCGGCRPAVQGLLDHLPRAVLADA